MTGGAASAVRGADVDGTTGNMDEVVGTRGDAIPDAGETVCRMIGVVVAAETGLGGTTCVPTVGADTDTGDSGKAKRSDPVLLA